MDGNDGHEHDLKAVNKLLVRLERAAVKTAVFLFTPLLAAALLVALLMSSRPQETAAQEPDLQEATQENTQAACLPEMVVTGNADTGPGSLREALQQVCPAGVVRLDNLAGQEVALSSTLVISQSLTLSGPAGGQAGATVTISGGGAVRVLEVRGRGLHVTLENLTVANGQVSDQAICQLYYFQRIFCGAGMLINPGNFVTVTHSTFRDNRVTEVGRGAGILALSSELTLLDDRFEGNITERNLGGAVYIEGGVLHVERSQFINNQAESGAGIFSGLSGIHVPEVSVSDSRFSANQATNNGAGIALGNGALSVRGSTFDNNQAQFGAGLYIYAGPERPGSQSATVENNTFSANQGGSGAGMQIYNQALVLRNNTLAGNQAAPERAALEILPGASVRFENNLFSGNSGDCRVMVAQPLAGRNNLFASPGGLACGAADGVDGNRVGGPAYVGALGDYGGPTPTIPLLPGSRAIDAGAECTALDQRGLQRPLPAGTACDIGAFESHGFHLAVRSGGRQATRVTTLFPSPLTVKVEAVNPIEPVDGGALTFTLPTTGASATLDSNPVTIAGGRAAPQATANDISASYVVQAQAAGAFERPVFNLTNTYQELIFDLNPQVPDPQLSDTKMTTSPCGDSFLGEFGNQTVTLNLNDLKPHAQALVTFDLFILRSWDGNEVTYTPAQSRVAGPLAPDAGLGPDRWSLAVDGVTVLDTSFSNWVEFGFRQAFPGTFTVDSYLAQTGAEKINSLCYDFNERPQDAVYHLAYYLDHSAPSMRLDFRAGGLQVLEDESWGLSNVRVIIANPGFGRMFAPVVNHQAP